MATVLENYYALRVELEQRMAQAPINAVDLWYYGEIVYRVGVLETCQMYLRSAPVSMNTPELLGHYQMMDAYVQSLALERRYGPDRGPDTQKEREAAQSNLGRVIQDYRKRFSAFSPTTAMAYKKEINRVITTLLPAWLQFRNTFVPIKKAKEGNASLKTRNRQHWQPFSRSMRWMVLIPRRWQWNTPTSIPMKSAFACRLWDNSRGSGSSIRKAVSLSR